MGKLSKVSNYGLALIFGTILIYLGSFILPTLVFPAFIFVLGPVLLIIGLVIFVAGLIIN
ncbi:MAG: hypothetical protein ACXADW_05960 [Candidatus Hodarchaeales archaeon]|jgi:hypothetical protein